MMAKFTSLSSRISHISMLAMIFFVLPEQDKAVGVQQLSVREVAEATENLFSRAHGLHLGDKKQPKRKKSVLLCMTRNEQAVLNLGRLSRYLSALTLL